MKAKLIFSLVTIVTLVSLLIGALPAQAAGNTWIVKSSFADDTNCTTAKRLCKTIQGAIDGASPGDIIRIYPGVYSAPVNIENKSNITLTGFGSSRTILKPATVLPWNVGGYGSSRTVAIRLVNSTNITINGIKLDMDLVKGNNVSGMLLWDSTGALQQSVLINNQVSDVSGGYYETGIRIRTDSSTYNASNRAVFTVTDSLFQDVGRVGINAHDWSHVIIRRSVFMKSAGANDFGYGVEIGSESTADIQQTKFSGFNTAALSDGSSSGGLYIESAFTGPSYDPDWATQKDKNVVIKYCEIYDNQIGLVIENSYNGLAGNVDTYVQMAGNYIHDNEYGVEIAEEDKEYGASTTVNSFNNLVVDNDYGYDIWTAGDGEIHATLVGETITNNSNGGVLVEHTGSVGNSIYDVTVKNSNISGNGTIGVSADSGISVNATNNWWGSDAGPGEGGNNGVVGGGSVTTDPFAKVLATGVTGSTHEVGETGTLDSNIIVNGLYGAQLQVNHDASVLSFVSGVTHTVSSSPPWAWDQVVENFKTTATSTRLSGTMRNDYHSVGANLTGESIATWTYQCNAPGGSNLTYDMTAGTGTILANKDGFAIPAALTGGVILCEPQTASVSGMIQLQGRLGTNPSPAGWNDAYVTLTCVSGACSGYGPYTTVTDSTGHYEWVKSGPGTGIPLGTYSVSVVRRAYLGAVKSSDVTIVAGSNTIPAPTLLGGDVNGDETISIADLSGIGGAFGNSVTPDTGMDVNGDGVVNVLDLVLAGGNFGLSSPQGW